MRKNQYERIARALVEAALYSDEYVLKKLKVNATTLMRWRSLAEKCPELQQRVELLLERSRADWLDQNADAGLAWIEFFRQASMKLNPCDPDAVKAAVNAYRAIGEMVVTRRLASDSDRSVCEQTEEQTKPLGTEESSD